jgi:arylsulfatase A-like enzyme
MSERPNILVCLTDDHAQWALGCYGNHEVQSPTLDYLAKTGVRMANAYTPTPVCSPSRACFHTGRLASQHGVHDFLMENTGYEAIRDRDWVQDELTLAEILAEHGYQTALSGKWHLGRVFDPHPGFEDWFGLDVNQYRHRGDNVFWHNGKAVETKGYTAGLTTDHAIDFLRRRDTQRPFFLFVGYIATHSPWHSHPDRLVDRYRRSAFVDIPRNDPVYRFGRLADESLTDSRSDEQEARAQYYASVTEIDEQMARLVDELETLGLREHTLIVYTSDHGLNCGQHGIWGKGNGTRPLNMLEESIRIPMIFNHPGGRALRGEGFLAWRGLFPGLVRQEPVTHCDLFQTLLVYAGVELPADVRAARRYPGRSFAPLLEGNALPDWGENWFGEYGNLRMIRTRRYKLVRRYPDGPCELFDLVQDPRETTNLFHEVEHQLLIRELTSRLEAFFAAYEDPEKTGLRIWDLPKQNPREAWREPDLQARVASLKQ